MSKATNLVKRILENPLISGLGLAISLAVAFSSRTSVAATWICIAIAAFLAYGLIAGFANKKKWKPRYLIASTGCSLLFLVAFGWWLTAPKRVLKVTPSFKYSPELTESRKDKITQDLNKFADFLNNNGLDLPNETPMISITQDDTQLGTTTDKAYYDEIQVATKDIDSGQAVTAHYSVWVINRMIPPRPPENPLNDDNVLVQNIKCY